ncbi:OX-2 membrane glycoprotein-like [Archocentrus centrarchus]|uniref:OX-2 membrane glycoprotein-like n=1 Tax=Archocentrus centrarchus TaxID=63155 RepID=UPI0011EA33F6|nr:OX-2 membrane glycoprotein-like [Archocentrus centrarchus]
MFLLLIAICWLSQASTSHITLHGNNVAEYGGEARYKCALSNSSGVLQVTWQRIVQGVMDSMATYSERFGREVTKPYRGKLLLTEASFSSASITLMNLTWKDETCYICSFNIFPDGSKMRQTCLKVQGISEVKTMNHTLSGGDGKDSEIVFSCSATGKPAPTIEWNISADTSLSDQPHSVIVTNSDHTFTTSRNVTVKVAPGRSGYVDCVLNRGKLGERTERIPFSYGEAERTTWERAVPSVIVFVAVVGVVSSIAAVFLMRRRSKKREEYRSATEALQTA